MSEPVPTENSMDIRKKRFLKTILWLVVVGAIGGGTAQFFLFKGEPLNAPEVPPEEWTASTNVADVLAYLGEPRADHAILVDSEAEKVGERLVYNGQLKDPLGGATPLISHYFRCTDCHNTVREDEDLATLSDPVAKLNYAVANDIPLLQGTTFAGMVNRETWYNDDYAKKYRFSPTVQLARNNLRKAIQLCCKECSQGRAPEKWEEDALLAYFWSLQWKLEDLNLNANELGAWKARAADPAKYEDLIADIKSRYALKSPATFAEMPEDAASGFAITDQPDLEVGRQVFEASCLHCHDPAEGAAERYFRDDEDTQSFLRRKFKSDSTKSAYGYIRLGTHPEDDQRLYMPNYPKEKLSDFQIESLRAYLSGEKIQNQ